MDLLVNCESGMNAFLAEGVNLMKTADAERKLDDVLTLVARARCDLDCVYWFVWDSREKEQCI
jgi:hypothetical protein